tara:strand:- start:1542 stop:1976 length:435 start_codon:yes stop_codon:yes gene_type:complete
MEYKYKEGYHCDICDRKSISYRCINCEYSRCSACHRDILASEEISKRLRKAKIKNDIKLAKLRLKEEGLTEWDVMVSNGGGEICYVNKLMKTYSSDYPFTEKTTLSPDEDLLEETLVRPANYRTTSQVRCGIANIYDYLKDLIS